MDNLKTYINCNVVSDGKILNNVKVVVNNDVIISIESNDFISVGEEIDVCGKYLAPGFIDIHCHGGGGYEFVDGTEEAVINACKVHASHGTRVIYPTISASDYNTTFKALEAIEKVKDNCACYIPGVHLEGPYLSPVMVGGQDADTIRKPNPDEYIKLYERFGNLISRWTYAPEEDENNTFLKFLKEKNIVPSAGHTNAEYCHILDAYNNGMNLITHLYSCTSTISRKQGFRYLGAIESAYLIDDMYVEAIADGKHLPVDLLKLIVKIKGFDKVCLITDALRPGGIGKTGEGKVFDNCAVPFIIEDGVAKLLDRSAFAGSIATTDILLETALSCGFELADCVKMLTQTPAEAMGLNDYGKIEPGYKAVFTIF